MRVKKHFSKSEIRAYLRGHNEQFSYPAIFNLRESLPNLPCPTIYDIDIERYLASKEVKAYLLRY